MGNINCCFKKNKSLDESIILSGRYCFQCNNVFETKQELVYHKIYCRKNSELNGDL